MTHLFTNEVFEIFDIPTLEGRMGKVREVIQPLFHHYATLVAQEITNEEEVPIHVAKHLRRTVYPPESTWVGIGGDKRGYKKYAHFQLGINQSYVFIVLAVIDNPPARKQMATKLLDHVAMLGNLPSDLILIPDHTKEDYIKCNEIDYNIILNRLQSSPKVEFMLGRFEYCGSSILNDEAQLTQWILQTIEDLRPYYNLLAPLTKEM